MSDSLRAILTRINVDPNEELKNSMLQELATLFERFQSPEIHTEFRSDVLKIITASIDLARTLSAPAYQIDEVLTNIAFLNSRIAFILNHVSTSRPRVIGHGLINKDKGKMLPNLFLNQREGEAYIAALKDMHYSNDALGLIPIEVTSRFVTRPTMPPVTEAPALPAPDFTLPKSPVPAAPITPPAASTDAPAPATPPAVKEPPKPAPTPPASTATPSTPPPTPPPTPEVKTTIPTPPPTAKETP